MELKLKVLEHIYFISEQGFSDREICTLLKIPLNTISLMKDTFDAYGISEERLFDILSKLMEFVSFLGGDASMQFTLMKLRDLYKKENPALEHASFKEINEYIEQKCEKIRLEYRNRHNV